MTTLVPYQLLNPDAQTALTAFRNKLINGDMRINQRVTAPTADGYGVDRWKFAVRGLTGILAQATDGTISAVGPTHVFMQSYVAKATLDAMDYLFFSQAVEGVNIADLKFGTAAAKPITISFRARVDGFASATISVSVRNSSVNRSYVAPVQVTSTPGWYSVTIPGDTSGTWNTDHTTGLDLSFTMACGSSFTAGAANAWSAGNFIAAPGQTNMAAVANAALSISDVQLESGSVATAFEKRPIGLELLLCQRYALRLARDGVDRLTLGAGGIGSTTAGFFALQFPVRMRIAPVLAITGADQFRLLGSNLGFGVTISAVEMSHLGATMTFTGSGLTPSGGVIVQTKDAPSPDPVLIFNAEL